MLKTCIVTVPNPSQSLGLCNSLGVMCHEVGARGAYCLMSVSSTSSSLELPSPPFFCFLAVGYFEGLASTPIFYIGELHHIVGKQLSDVSIPADLDSPLWTRLRPATSSQLRFVCVLGPLGNGTNTAHRGSYSQPASLRISPVLSYNTLGCLLYLNILS